jgi:hypothetical protein
MGIIAVMWTLPRGCIEIKFSDTFWANKRAMLDAIGANKFSVGALKIRHSPVAPQPPYHNPPNADRTRALTVVA